MEQARQSLMNTLNAVLQQLIKNKNENVEMQMNTGDSKADYHRDKLAEQAAKLSGKAFWVVCANGAESMFYDASTRLLWNAQPDLRRWSGAQEAAVGIAKKKIGNIGSWRVPTEQELLEFHNAPACPGKAAPFDFFLHRSPWLNVKGTVAVGTVAGDGVAEGNARLIEVNDLVGEASYPEFIEQCVQRGWSLFDAGDARAIDLLAPLRAAVPLRLQWRDIDYRGMRLPMLEDTQFDDAAKGMWEAWGMDADTLRAEAVRARNPAEDVRDWDVAIDFGTSSTVVAINEHGKRKLLRVGVGNFLDQEEASNYENPTMLEFLDWTGLMRVWQNCAYRPDVDWEHVRCSHAALQDFLSSDKSHQMIGSLLMHIKQWVLDAEAGKRVFITDGRQVERELLAPSVRNPVRGMPLELYAGDDFDPVELYAWFIGMNINWRGRGLFLRYCMTFPVDYPQLVKDKILASFRRGLQRSLPSTLLTAPEFQNFRVDEVASEPAAYAAAALPSLGILPTREGVAYSVFDFGGGSSDFDFGHYRLPAEHEDPDLEQILERHGAAGDRYLGGENLLANLAYRVFQDNLAACLELGAVFTRPLDADAFPGHERIVEQGRYARTNTLVLMSILRPLWETGRMETQSPTIPLFDRSGKRSALQLKIAKSALLDYLEQRIGQGVLAFCVAMQKAYQDAVPDHVHVLLAGNSSLCRQISGYFGLDDEDAGKSLHAKMQAYMAQVFGEKVPGLTVHPALASNPKDLFQPTAKTGVALGLLRLCDGGVAAVVDHSRGEAPFAYYVGRIRQDKFQPVLMQGHAYGEWVELGRPRAGVFKLSYSQSPLAYTGEMAEGAHGLLQMRLEFAGIADGQRVFARAIEPAVIDICTAAGLSDIDAALEARRIVLKQ